MMICPDPFSGLLEVRVKQQSMESPWNITGMVFR